MIVRRTGGDAIGSRETHALPHFRWLFRFGREISVALVKVQLGQV